MTMNILTKSDFMSIRSWLRAAAFGLICLASLSCVVHYKMAADVQSYADHLRQSSRLQTVNAELARDATAAWLSIEAGDRTLAAPALTDLRQHRTRVQGIMDEFSASQGQHPAPHVVYNRAHWSQLRASLSRLIEIAEPIVARSKMITPAAGPATPATLSIDRTAFQEFTEVLKSNSATTRFSIVQSHSSLRWVLQYMCTSALAMTGAMIAYGLFIFLFIGHRIRARTAEVSNRILQYTNGAFSPPARKPQGDEFGIIEAQVDECARTVYGCQMKVASAHETTLKQLKDRTQELGKLNEALRASGRALVRFLTDVSHDLRTPLAIMVGESEVSLRSKSTSIGEYKETLSKMLEQTRYLGSLVDQLLYTARSKVSAVPLEPEYIDVAKLVRSACRDMKTLADNREIAINTNDSATSTIVLGDQIRLREMILTILDNAIEYSKPSSAISVSIVEQAPYLKIVVADTGIGIPSSEMPMIFRRFYRAENAPDANAQGTGIGLAVAKGIVESHNGTIEIESKENQGTVVTLLLPLVEEPRLENEIAPSEAIANATERPNHTLI